MPFNRRVYDRIWWRANADRINEKRRKRRREKLEKCRQIVNGIVNNKSKKGYWWEEE